MADNTDSLRDIFMDVSDEATLTERQQEEPSHDPIEDDSVEQTVSEVAVHDGLDDAVAGAEVDGSGATG